MTAESSPREKRQAPRYNCAGDAEIAVPGCGLRFTGRIVDLSAGGCFIETKCRLERGTSVELCMSARGFPLRLAANLVVQRPSGAGFRFHSVSPRKLELIHTLIGELAEELDRKAAAEMAENQPRNQPNNQTENLPHIVPVNHQDQPTPTAPAPALPTRAAPPLKAVANAPSAALLRRLRGWFFALFRVSRPERSKLRQPRHFS